jgi:predicted DNA-binding transcriptional regulator
LEPLEYIEEVEEEIEEDLEEINIELNDKDTVQGSLF